MFFFADRAKQIEFVFFFFQAEDGIRDLTVTGVQTCALPIYGGGGQERVPSGRNVVEEVEAAVVHRRREPAVEHHLRADRGTAVRPGDNALDPADGRDLEDDVERDLLPFRRERPGRAPREAAHRIPYAEGKVPGRNSWQGEHAVHAARGPEPAAEGTADRDRHVG